MESQRSNIRDIRRDQPIKVYDREGLEQALEEKKPHIVVSGDYAKPAYKYYKSNFYDGPWSKLFDYGAAAVSLLLLIGLLDRYVSDDPKTFISAALAMTYPVKRWVIPLLNPMMRDRSYKVEKKELKQEEGDDPAFEPYIIFRKK